MLVQTLSYFLRNSSFLEVNAYFLSSALLVGLVPFVYLCIKQIHCSYGIFFLEFEACRLP